MQKTEKKFAINNYVLFKTQEGWGTGRIARIAVEDTREVAHVVCLSSFSEIAVTDVQHLVAISTEAQARLNVSPIQQNPGRIAFPPILKSIMDLDSEWVKCNAYARPAAISVAQVLAAFEAFVVDNAPGVPPSEIKEASRGFIRAFEFLLPTLLYRNERKSHAPLLEPVTQSYGPIYLLRLLYFLQKGSMRLVKQALIRNILMLHTALLLDFLFLNYKVYF